VCNGGFGQALRATARLLFNIGTKRAALFIGNTGAGKSFWLDIISTIFPADIVTWKGPAYAPIFNNTVPEYQPLLVELHEFDFLKGTRETW
jgi:energy-coupling factor transporter ATP-binding protein EcfA2